ncbi:MAG: TonB-dependent receptor plug domain-containing protein [Mongoliitalea sp.]
MRLLQFVVKGFIVIIFYIDPIEKIRTSFERWIQEMPEEKVFLHFDRDIFAAGETIWLKAYLTSGPYLLPSSLSQTLYIELWDSNNHVVKRELIYGFHGFSTGYLELPDSLNTGEYRIRAYTQWMRNNDEAYFYERIIQVYGEKSINQDTVSSIDSLTLQFFPEGGTLVQNLFSKVAFKVVGSDGLGRKIEGVILEDDTEITQFRSNHLGTGIFPLVPQQGKIYTAKIHNHPYIYVLPVALPTGIVMAVNNNPEADFLQVKLLASVESKLEEVYLLAQSRGVVNASAKVDLSNGIAFIRLPKQEFLSGIVQLTVLDKEGVPLTERLVFVDQGDQLRINIQSPKQVYLPREETSLEIEVLDKNGEPVQGNFSLRVVDSTLLPESQNVTSIRTHLLMTSELKGFVESPEYYFDEKNEDRWEALDYLLLTQGWRKYSIQEASKGILPESTFGVERGISIRGTVINQVSKQPVSNADVSFLSVNPIISSLSVKSDQDGRFEMNDLYFYDGSEVLLEVKAAKNRKSLELLIDEDKEGLSFSKRNTINNFQKNLGLFWEEAKIRKSIEQAFPSIDNEVFLDEVEVLAKKNSNLEGKPRIYVGGTTKIQVSGNPALENLFHPLDLLRGRVPGVQVSGSGQNKSVAIQGINSLNSSSQPLIMVDDIPVSLEVLLTLPVEEIEEVTVWKGGDTAIFGSRGSNGAIGFYTKRGKISNAVEKIDVKKNLPQGFKGYQVHKEFYSPSYDGQQLRSPKPDRRVTLFWEPMIETDVNGKASINFFNHDLESEILVEIQGLSFSGIPGSAQMYYRIQK